METHTFAMATEATRRQHRGVRTGGPSLRPWPAAPSPQRAPLHSQLQQDGQGQVLVLQRDAARPFGARCPVDVPEMTAVDAGTRQHIKNNTEVLP